MGEEALVTDVWVICKTCGKRHRVKRGMDAPIYWCGDELRKLVEGDGVECGDEPGVLGGKGQC